METKEEKMILDDKDVKEKKDVCISNINNGGANTIPPITIPLSKEYFTKFKVHTLATISPETLILASEQFKSDVLQLCQNTIKKFKYRLEKGKNFYVDISQYLNTKYPRAATTCNDTSKATASCCSIFGHTLAFGFGKDRNILPFLQAGIETPLENLIHYFRQNHYSMRIMPLMKDDPRTGNQVFDPSKRVLVFSYTNF